MRLALILCTLAAMGLAVPTGRPSTPTPRPEAKVVSVAPRLAGKASWYEYYEGQAAAGPALRSALGKDWRGSTVRVCTDRCITVRLTDWCQCYKGEKRERIIDLDVRSFDALGDPGEGVMKVTVERP